MKVYLDKTIFIVGQVYKQRSDWWITSEERPNRTSTTGMVLGAWVGVVNRKPPYFFPMGRKWGLRVAIHRVEFTIQPPRKAIYPGGKCQLARGSPCPHIPDGVGRTVLERYFVALSGHKGRPNGM